MSVKPILFSAPMVRALLDGRKTQTRRVMKDQATWDRIEAIVKRFPRQKSCVPYAPSDLLYVREAIGRRPASAFGIEATNGVESAFYIADDEDVVEERGFNVCPWWAHKHTLPGIHMPRWASRLTLRVTDVRVQRVQDISEDDALAEGLLRWEYTDVDGDPRVDPLARAYTDVGFHWKQTDTPFDGFGRARDAFENLWDSLNGPRGFGWDENPWVCAVTFEAIKANVDELANTRERAEREEQ